MELVANPPSSLGGPSLSGVTRLFLKLVAQVELDGGIEPLPDIDFNMRTGNTLVGFATYEEVRKAIQGDVQARMDLGGDMERIDAAAGKADEVFEDFRKQQTASEPDPTSLRQLKSQLSKQLDDLSGELDRYLASEYGTSGSKLEAWRESHQPFHWFVEFYGTMKEGGFDVIIGNPPYIEYSKVRTHYEVLPDKYSTISCGNIYAPILERCFTLSSPHSLVGMIVQLSAICTDRMKPLQDLYLSSADTLWAACFDDRPAKLFDGLEHIRAAILLSSKGAGHKSVVLHNQALTLVHREPSGSISMHQV